MTSEFSPRDPALPLVLTDDVLDGAIYEPAMEVVGYVNALYAAGYRPGTLREDLADFYLLDFYQGQVRNGGHSQYIHNSGPHLAENLAAARRGALRLDLEPVVALIDACAAWCRAHPGEAAAQDGFDVRAEALEPLDRRLYAVILSEADLAALIGDLPADLGARLEAKLILPGDAEDRAAAFVARTLAEMGAHGAEAAALAASAVLDPLIDRSVLLAGRGRRREDHAARVERVRGRICGGLDTALGRLPEADWAGNLDFRARSAVIRPGLYDRSAYHVAAWVWIARHPRLTLVPAGEVAAARQSVIDRSAWLR